MNKDALLLTFVILLMILALAGAAMPTAKKLSDLLTDPIGKISVEQAAKK